MKLNSYLEGPMGHTCTNQAQQRWEQKSAATYTDGTNNASLAPHPSDEIGIQRAIATLRPSLTLCLEICDLKKFKLGKQGREGNI